MNPDPIADLAACDSPLDKAVSEQLQRLALDLPVRIAEKQLRSTMQQLPVFDMTSLIDVTDGRIVERAFQIYAHFANAYINNHDALSAYVLVSKEVQQRLVSKW